MPEGPFHVVWEDTSADDWNNPDAVWHEREKSFDSELDAVRHWHAMIQYANTRPVSITPEPEWGKYTYDGHTPGTKF